MKLTALKTKALKVLTAATLAGALFTAAAPAAQAQQFGVAVHVGGPYGGGSRYFAPPPPRVIYGGPVFYGGYRDYHRDWRFHHGWR